MCGNCCQCVFLNMWSRAADHGRHRSKFCCAWLARFVSNVPYGDQTFHPQPSHDRRCGGMLRCHHVNLHFNLQYPSLLTPFFDSGTVVAGSVSQVAGRRLTIILFLLFAAVFIPLWMLPSAFAKLCAGVFWVQFFAQGATGVVPIWLAELSPPGFSALFIGVIAQLGSVSSYLAFCLHEGLIPPLRRINRCWDPDLGKWRPSWLERNSSKRRSFWGR